MNNSRINVGFCENGAGYGGAVVSLAAFLEHIPADLAPYIYTSIGTSAYQRLADLGQWRHVPSKPAFDPKKLARFRLPCVSMIDNVVNIAPYAMRLRRGFLRDRTAITYLNNDPICNLAPALAAKLARTPMVLHARGFSADTPGARWVLAAINHCIAVSKAVKTQLMALGLDGNKCTVVPEGLDLNRFHPRPPSPTLRSELGYDEFDQVITLVGGLIDWKGQDVLLDACPAIFESVPNAKVLLVGSAYGRNNDFSNAIARRVQDSSLSGRVQLLGAREDVPEILSLSSVVVHASTRPEPFGRTFLEGMAMGKPVIASNEGGPREVVTDEVDGLLIAPRDPHGLAQAVIRLLRDRPFADSMARRAAMTAKQYSIARHTDAISSVIRDVYRNSQGASLP